MLPGNPDAAPAEAAIWLARLERGLQAQEGAQLQEWLQQPAHRNAIVEAAKLWHGPDIIAVLSELVPVGFGNPPAPAPKKKWAHRVVVLFALCLVVFVWITPSAFVWRTMPRLRPGLLGAKYQPPQQALLWGESVYTTKPGETRAVTLPDGSKVTLNGHTQLKVLFLAQLRVANLQYGEAIFQIAHELQRPFEVNAGGRHFWAPPSMFDVRISDPQTVDLLVLNGGVTVQGLPWHWPETPAEARLFDPSVFVDSTVGPLHAALFQDSVISRYAMTEAAAHARLRWQPEDVVYVTP